MHLVVGLGNPGETYVGTRHNVGFQAVDYLAESRGLTFGESKWPAKIAKGTLGGEPVILVKPDTYMNESGRAVGPLAAYYRVPPGRIIVLHDDLDLTLSRIMVVVNRGAGGHNGIGSLIDHLGGREFVRVRIGVGRPEGAMPVKNFVLARFQPQERELMLARMPSIAEAVCLVLERGVLAAMAAVNGQSKKPSA